MKIISLVSSHRKDGNTARTVSLIEEQLLSLAKANGIDIQIERINLAHQNIQLCRGCRVCFDHEESQCPLKDDILLIRDKLLQADAIIAASPVYVEDCNGIMKNWIDRMAFQCHRPVFAGKSVLVLSTSGMGASKHTLRTVGRAFRAWGANIADQANFRTGALTEKTEIASLYHKRIKKLAIEFFINFEGTNYVNPSFYSLMTFKVQQLYWQRAAHKEDSYDYVFWQEKGWLEKDCIFYLPIQSSIYKIRFARMMGAIAAKFFI